MKLIPCYNPKSVYNKYVGSYVYARCGKCPACLNARSASWVTRLDLEMQAHKYTFFVTLQYDEQHVNQYIRVDDSRLAPPDTYTYIDSETSQVISLSEVENVKPSDIEFCKNTKILCVASVRDFQLFIKKLRAHVKKYYATNFRYYNTFEYGPTTFRPHTHCLFFFDAPLLAQDFAKLCDKFWINGVAFEPHLVSDSVSSYVASYVNCNANLPAIYRHRLLRQKSTFSTCPPIGFNIFDTSTIKKYLTSRPYKITLFKKALTFIDVPYFRSFEHRLFPKCPRFGLLSRGELSLVYGLAKNLPYIDDVICYDLSLVRFYCRYIFKLSAWYRAYFDMVFRDDEHNIIKDSVERFVRMLVNFRRTCLELNLSAEEYINLIVDYYDYKQISQFYEFLNLQKQYFLKNPVSHYLMFFPNFLRAVNGRPFGALSDSQKFYLTEYGYNYTDDDIVNIIPRCPALGELKALHNKIYYQNTKTKINNDYLLANKDKFGNVIAYYDSLKN